MEIIWRNLSFPNFLEKNWFSTNKAIEKAFVDMPESTQKCENNEKYTLKLFIAFKIT